MTTKTLRARFAPDPYIVAILGMVGLATLLPVQGVAAVGAGYATKVAIALLFFLHGARLAPRAAIAGARHWRLHAMVLAATFVAFPALGLAARAMAPDLLSPTLWTGLILLCVLPSTVQSSIAFTSIARGNVPAALCAATASNMLGMVLTPLLAGLLLHTQGGFSFHAAIDIATQLLLPFLAGQFARRWIGDWAARNRTLLGLIDRGSILMVVYVAFSAGVIQGLWRQIGLVDLLTLAALDLALLAAMLALTIMAARLVGLCREDEIAVVFCGSKKSLASGLPIATVLLAGHPVGLVVLPLMIFHQLQLMACAALARRYAGDARDPGIVVGDPTLSMTRA